MYYQFRRDIEYHFTDPSFGYPFAQSRAKIIYDQLHTVEKNYILKLQRFFPSRRRKGDEKERQFQNWIFFGLNGVIHILS